MLRYVGLGLDAPWFILVCAGWVAIGLCAVMSVPRWMARRAGGTFWRSSKVDELLGRAAQRVRHELEEVPRVPAPTDDEVAAFVQNAMATSSTARLPYCREVELGMVPFGADLASCPIAQGPEVPAETLATAQEAWRSRMQRDQWRPSSPRAYSRRRARTRLVALAVYVLVAYGLYAVYTQHARNHLVLLALLGVIPGLWLGHVCSPKQRNCTPLQLHEMAIPYKPVYAASAVPDPLGEPDAWPRSKRVAGPCSTCRGTGLQHIAEHKGTCQTCKGSGEVGGTLQRVYEQGETYTVLATTRAWVYSRPGTTTWVRVDGRQCGACVGTGQVTIGAHDQTCASCHGSRTKVYTTPTEQRIVAEVKSQIATFNAHLDTYLMQLTVTKVLYEGARDIVEYWRTLGAEERSATNGRGVIRSR